MELEQSDKQLGELNERLEKLHMDNDFYRKQAKMFEKGNLEHRQAYADTYGQIQKNLATIEQKDKEMFEYQQRVDESNSKMIEIMDENKNLQYNLETLKSSSKEVLMSIRSLQLVLKQNFEQKILKQKSKNKSDEDLMNLNFTIKVLSGQMANSEKEFAKENNFVEEIKRNLAKQRESICKLKIQIEDASDKENSKNINVSEFSNALEELKRENFQAKNSLDKINKDVLIAENLLLERRRNLDERKNGLLLIE